MVPLRDIFPALRSIDRLHELQLPDVNLEAERSRRVARRWRCSCGHVERATDQPTLRAQAIAHHAERHTPSPHEGHLGGHPSPNGGH